LIVRDKSPYRQRLLALLLLAPVITGCSGASMFSTDILSKDAEWFSRPSRLFIRNIEAPPLSPTKPITADDLVSAEGSCPGMAPPGNPVDANASSDGAVGAPVVPSTTGTVALGHTECDVVRGIGAPGSVNLSKNERGDRVAVVTYLQGQRAGIYTFTAGRLTSVERLPEQAAPPAVAKPKTKRKKPAAAT
jgi:hypothetical protein